MWNADGAQQDTLAVIPDSSYAAVYGETIDFCKAHGAFDPATRSGVGHRYRLGGMTCLAGDVIGDYAFEQPLVIGQRLVFVDMAHYTMVKTSTFNGIPLPAIAVWDSRTDELEIVREFGYEDFRQRLS